MSMTQDEMDTILVGDDPQPSVSLEGRTLKKQAIDDLISRAMSGLIPRGRELKSWEPDFIDERHLQAIMMRASGLEQNVIAKVMGWTDSWVSIVLNHPDSQYILTKVVGYAADDVLEIQTRIKAYAGEALDKVVEVMRTTQDQRLSSSNAFEILKMAGYAAVEKKEIRTTVSVTKEQSSLLVQAINESKQIKALEGVDYRVVVSSVPERVSSVAPAALASGRIGAGQPPVSDVQETEDTHDGTRVRAVA